MYEKFGLFINGDWIKSFQNGEVRSPVTEGVLGTVSMASPRDTVSAIDAAERAMTDLRKMGGFERADALHRAADAMISRKSEAAHMISSETGKPIAQAEREWSLACDQFRWYAEEARRIYGSGKPCPRWTFRNYRRTCWYCRSIHCMEFPSSTTSS